MLKGDINVRNLRLNNRGITRCREVVLAKSGNDSTSR